MSNKRIDFTQLGGFPLTQDALDFMQQSYRDAITGIAKLAGDAVILSGMTDNGVAITDGWIVYNGELLFFKGGNKQTYFVIQEITGQEQFEDDSMKTVYFTRQAVFGSGAGQIAYATLIRLDTVKTLKDNIATLNETLAALSANLTAHEADTANPHQVTKNQVGLGNLPNAVSDSINLQSSVTLATSQAVYNAVQANQKIIGSGSYYIGNAGTNDDKRTVIHDLNIAGTYIVVGNLRSVGSNWNNDNDVFAMIRNITSNSFDILLREINGNPQALYFDYILIKA